MAKSGGARGGPAKRGRNPGKSAQNRAPKRGSSTPAKGGAKATGARPKPAKRPTAEPASVPPMPEWFALGAIPGATPGKWIDIWNERMPRTALDLVPLSVADQRRALVAGEVDAALVRLPLDKDGLHVIALYDEVPVVVMAKDSHLTVADDLGLDDLAGEVLIVAADAVIDVDVPEAVAPRFAPPADTADAIATVAAGVGVVIVPMSLARLHHRKDTDHRPLRDGPTSTVALAWRAGDENPAVQAFVGIVRGRTANSTRG